MSARRISSSGLDLLKARYFEFLDHSFLMPMISRSGTWWPTWRGKQLTWRTSGRRPTAAWRTGRRRSAATGSSDSSSIWREARVDSLTLQPLSRSNFHLPSFDQTILTGQFAGVHRYCDEVCHTDQCVEDRNEDLGRLQEEEGLEAVPTSLGALEAQE